VSFDPPIGVGNTPVWGESPKILNTEYAGTLSIDQKLHPDDGSTQESQFWSLVL
jgi:hypothetical protein